MSFISLGVRPGLVIAIAIPLTLAIVFSFMELANIDMQRISLGALIIALAFMVDDAMTTTDATLTRLAQGDSMVDAATFAFRTYAVAMLAGTLVTIAGFVPVGFAASSAGEYTFSLFAVVAMALVVSWFVAVIFAPLLGLVILTPPKSTETKEGLLLRLFRRLLTGPIRARWLTIALALALFIASIFAMPLIPNQFFPSSDRPELLVDLTFRKMRRSTRPRRWRSASTRSLKYVRRRALEHLCRAPARSALSAAQCAIAEQFLRSSRGGRERRGGPRTAQGETRESCSQTNSRPWWHVSIRSNLGRRSDGRTGNIASPVRTSPRSENSLELGELVATSPVPRTSTTTGWSRRVSCVPKSIRTKRGCWA